MSGKIVLDDSDVVSIFTGGSNPAIYTFGLGSGSTFKSSELIKAAKTWVAKPGTENNSYCWWFNPDGLKCQVLFANEIGWKPGKVRIRLEFIPDEPKVPPQESPLDDLRSNLDI
ncbi:KGK domain-containing protein [Nostoc sp. PCC 7107]|uniref:KGK domain-containing protein n=1 Tax=Nostoc sp. PCC 7107 TaxID=317936 RepID=UPI00029F4E4B|nr:KGK domain-containing protein [Nostoc sp. PCC 7107]AFY43642.1 KGK family protein [Nostoc sp. PCC 7107]